MTVSNGKTPETKVGYVYCPNCDKYIKLNKVETHPHYVS